MRSKICMTQSLSHNTSDGLSLQKHVIGQTRLFSRFTFLKGRSDVSTVCISLSACVDPVCRVIVISGGVHSDGVTSAQLTPGCVFLFIETSFRADSAGTKYCY